MPGDIRKIKQIIENNIEISKVDELKTNYMGPPEVRVAGLVKYNAAALKDSALLRLESEIKAAATSSQEELAIKQLVCKAVDLLLTHTTEIVEDIEEDIVDTFPEATEIHIEMSYTPKRRVN